MARCRKLVGSMVEDHHLEYLTWRFSERHLSTIRLEVTASRLHTIATVVGCRQWLLGWRPLFSWKPSLCVIERRPFEIFVEQCVLLFQLGFSIAATL